MPIFTGKLDFNEMFVFRNSKSFWITFPHNLLTFAVSFSRFGRTCRDPAFPRTIGVTVPFGPSGFLKVLLGMEICSFFVFSIFVCDYFFYIDFLSLLLVIPQ